MVERVKLTDRKLQSLKPAKPGQRYELMDALHPRLGVRVTDSGHRSFIYVGRFPGKSNPTRRAIPHSNLAEARETAIVWDRLIAKGVDPRQDIEKQKLAELRKNADTFEAGVTEYEKRVLVGRDPKNPKTRSGNIRAAELRAFGEKRKWSARPITSIERHDIVDGINEILDRGATYQAHNLFGHVRGFFNWALEDGRYGLEQSPCDRIRPKRLIGERKPRQRTLEDNEIRAFWRATERMGYPFGPLFQLLFLTACRKNEIAGALWTEIDLKKKLLTIPAERFKSDSQHLVPLTDAALALVEALPRFGNGDYVFTSTLGQKPVSGFAGAKERLDKLMAEELGAELKPFRTHDLRRTVRTKLASLRVSDTIAEMVIGHGRKGIQRVYDQHQYEAEMREALELWAARLRDIVSPSPDNVLKMKRARRDGL
jgi:integrase